MKKAILTLKLLLWIAAIALLGFLYYTFRRDTSPQIIDPEKPDDVATPNLLGKLLKRKDDINEEINNMSRTDLVADINEEYTGEGSRSESERGTDA